MITPGDLVIPLTKRKGNLYAAVAEDGGLLTGEVSEDNVLCVVVSVQKLTVKYHAGDFTQTLATLMSTVDMSIGYVWATNWIVATRSGMLCLERFGEIPVKSELGSTPVDSW